MFSHIVVGVRDFERALAFYEPLMASLPDIAWVALLPILLGIATGDEGGRQRRGQTAPYRVVRARMRSMGAVYLVALVVIVAIVLSASLA